MAFDDWGRFGRYLPASRARPIEGGIKASSKRGEFAQNWWGRRWIEVLESFDIGSRLQRGRSYARKGQVLSIDVKKGVVEARVQGSRRDPYSVHIKVRPLTPSEWKRLADELASQAMFAAKLLAGEMPQDIEAAFEKAGLSLFPQKLAEISTACSCPDSSNPCKHVAAVYYLLGEAFDRDPFLVFRLRGMEREEFMPMLGEAPPLETDSDAEAAPPLPSDPEEFWRAKPLPPDLLVGAEASRPPAALAHRLGNLQFWQGSQPLPVALESTYQRAAEQAAAILSR